MMVTLGKMWLSDIVTGRTFGWYTGDDRQQSYAVRGEARFYADGNRRAITSPGMSESWKFTLMELTLADTVTITAWLANNVTILARDHRGQYMYGSFFSADFAENKAYTYDSPQNTYMGSITLQAVDVVEGV